MWSTLAPFNACKTPLLAPALALLAVVASPISCCVYAQGDQAEPPPIAAQRSPQEIATQILHLALHEAVWGVPAYCSVRQQIHLNGHQINGFGKFVRAGRGGGKLKLSMQFPAGNSMNTLLQVSDGQRLHTIEDISGTRKRTIVDLDKVRKPLIISNQSLYDPVIAMYLAIGGQAESLRKLCQQYEWTDVTVVNYADEEAWLLSGELAKTPPAIRAMATTDQALHSPNQSGLLPTKAEVIIRKSSPDADLPYWLFEVRQTRSTSDPSPVGFPAQLKLVTEWAEPALIQPSELQNEFFEATSGNDPFYEETEIYLPPASTMASRPSPPLQETRANVR